MRKNSFRRYTTLPFLLDMLYEKRLALLDPASWDDKNDSYFLELYKTNKNLKSLLALCFADAPETYQHWKIYSGNSSGVCIEFNKGSLLKWLNTSDGFISKAIRYEIIENLQEALPELNELPFIKRYAFKDEQEHRIVYEDYEEEIKIKYISIEPKDIKFVILNPWVDKSVFYSIRSIIKKIDGCNNIRVRKSTVVENDQWKNIGKNAISDEHK